MRRRVMRAVTAIAFCAIGACRDASFASPLPPASHPATPGIARLRATVDVESGTMSFEPAGSGQGASLSSAAPNAAIYGDQGVNVRIYNSAVVTSASVAGKKTYSASVGVRNLLGYRIGDEQGTAAPPDTMGIYVFLSSQPIVSGTSSTCAACVVTVKNRHGTLNFNGTNQAYWFWPELLGAANGGADTTLLRKTWVFEADTAVTRFNFDVLVSAAWSAPNENVWRVEYPGDSLPDTESEPAWKKLASNGGPTAVISGGLVLSLKKTKDSLTYVRRDSLRTATAALMEARFRLDDGGNSAEPQPGIAMDDNTRYIGLFVSDSGAAGRGRVGFVDAAGDGFVAGASDTLSAVNAFRVYQLRKYGADSAAIYVDGVRRVKVLYSVLPVTTAPLPLPSFVKFGLVGGATRTTMSTWDYVVYQLGQATP